MGMTVILALTVLNASSTLTVSESLSGFSNEVAWLVLGAFFIAKGFLTTGLGHRIAYFFVWLLGKRTLGLGYGIMAADLVMAPAIPSAAARCAGIVYPIVRGISESYKSLPNSDSARDIGAYLTIVAFQATVITSAMFMTAMAANPLLAQLSLAQGISLSWGSWAIAASVPGVISLALLPLVVYYFYPPKVTYTPQAPQLALKKLKEMGQMKGKEWAMVCSIMGLLVLWIFGTQLMINPTVAAFIGLSALLLTGVLTWKDILKEESAWDTFIWFSVLLMMANFLNKLGVVPWFSQHTVQLLTHVDWKYAFPLLALVYFYSHYFFASGTAHVTSMYAAFLSVVVALGAPPMLAALTLIFFSNLFGGITHYSFSPAPVLFGAGYVDIKNWWKMGAIMSVVNIAVWTVFGGLWWKYLGWW